MLIVTAVTSVVVLYSGVYIEHYNNKKFLSLLFLFFRSMALLSMSDSLLVAIVGWDGLGISSIFLIIFYPNNRTLYNSLLTMFFNRLGDVVLILVLCHFLGGFGFFYFLGGQSSNWSLYFLGAVLICGFSKRAQFPLSRWLPAAISAPTPISAIVHSSTLVTAGIFLLNKIRRFLFAHPLLVSF